MKSSRLILVIAGALLLAATAYTLIGQADAPTSLTDAQGLKAQLLPQDLPAISEPDDPGKPGEPGGPEEPGGDAGIYYERAISLYDKQRGAPPNTGEHDQLVAGLCKLLIQAAGAGHVETGFMDRHLPVEIGAEPDFADAVEAIYELAIYQSAYRHTHQDPKGARELALAVWVLGRRMFEDNVRLYNRVVGLDMMESAGSLLYEMAVDHPGSDHPGSDDPGAGLDGDALRAWSEAINTIRQHWQPKLEVVLGLDPPIGDLINIARNDGDRMFRIEATLRLGIHQHGSIGRGNRRAIHNAIQSAIQSDDPILAQAGRAADALTLKQKRRLY